MIADDWNVLMHALSIQVQAIHFSKGTSQKDQEAIADHMIGVADFIEAYPVPQYVKTISECSDEQLRRLKVTELQVKERDTEIEILNCKLASRDCIIGGREHQLEDANRQVDEYRRFCEEIVKGTETDLTPWKRRAQFVLDAMDKQEEEPECTR